jgi:hypothetical protein
VSRLTFRDAQDHTAWQRQLRDHYLDEGVPPVPHLSVKRARVRRVSRKLAEQIILKYEWLGTMANTRQHYGIFFGLHCAGVTCMAIGTGTGGVNVHKEFHLTPQEVGLLARGACVHWAPSGANSKLVSWTCRLLARDTKSKIVIAYSDTDAGEIGTIYQACNWVYIGRGSSTEQYIAPNGRIYDQKLVYNLRKQHGILDTVSWSEQRQALLDNGWRAQKTNPKHRYVWVIDKGDKALVNRIERMAQPYPKRNARAADGSTLASS